MPVDVSMSERLVWVVLALHAGPDDVARVSRSRVAEMCGLSEGRVKQLMRSLREKGLSGAPASVRTPDGHWRYMHPLIRPVSQEERVQGLVAERRAMSPREVREDPFEVARWTQDQQILEEYNNA